MAKPKRVTKKHLVMCEALLPDATQRDLLRQMIQPLEYLRCAISVTDFEGNPYTMGTREWLTTNGTLHDTLVEFLKID